VAWVPLLVLTLAEGHFLGGSTQLPFLHDLEMHARLLLAMPLLIAAELIVNRRLRPVVGQFLARGLIPDAARARFDRAIASGMGLRNSILAEVLLVGLVYVIGIGFIWRTQIALGVASWYGVPVEGKLQPTLAGWWMICVSLPLFQFLLLRWYYRLVIWARFLWQVSRLELGVVPTHPDRCGGLGFLGSVSPAFSPVLLAQGALLAGMMADRIFFAGGSLPEFKVDMAGLMAVMLFAILGPLLVFTPGLAAAKRKGLREYGVLAQHYTREFDRKWLRGGAAPDEPLIGSADIQSLADLGNSYAVVKDMRLVPFTLQTVLQLAAATALPAAPLLLTIIPLEEIVARLLKVVL
jgi:hypothetical protein